MVVWSESQVKGVSSTATYSMMAIAGLTAALSIFIFGFSIWASVSWKRMWMTVDFIPSKPRGQDVEDILPGYLARSGATIRRDTDKHLTATKDEVERALDDLVYM
jgi:hypothetical protein